MKILKWFIVILFWVKSKIVLFVSKRFKRFKWLKSWEYKTVKAYRQKIRAGSLIESDKWAEALRSNPIEELEPGLRKIFKENFKSSDDSSS